jgi:hypothetical protein
VHGRRHFAHAGRENVDLLTTGVAETGAFYLVRGRERVAVVWSSCSYLVRWAAARCLSAVVSYSSTAATSSRSLSFFIEITFVCCAFHVLYAVLVSYAFFIKMSDWRLIRVHIKLVRLFSCFICCCLMIFFIEKLGWRSG